MNELAIALNQKSKVPLYEQIYDYIKHEIQNGNIKFNDKLPSTRTLANHLQVSRSTVELAYEQLMSEGYIESAARRGYFVSQIDGLYNISSLDNDFIIPKKDTDIDYDYDFSPNGIDLEDFPFNIWRKISKNTLLDDDKDLFNLGSPNGEPDLRVTIANYLHQARGVNCSHEQIILGAGNDYLLMLLSMILGKKHTIAMENPTYIQAYRTFKNLKYKVDLIQADKNGLSVEKLRKIDATLVYAMPSHQFPLGIIMPIKRRMELLNWANESENRYIIEDDYDSEFRYKGKPIPSLQAIDINGKVIYLGTFSKSIAPAIRVSYMVLPKKLMQRYYENQGFYTSTVSKIDQHIIYKFINEGYYERHLNKMRAIYKHKHDTLLKEIKTLGNNFTISGENAGLHILLNFKKGISEEYLVNEAAKSKVKVYKLSEYCIDDKNIDTTTIIIGYATMRSEEIVRAVSILREAWKDII